MLFKAFPNLCYNFRKVHFSSDSTASLDVAPTECDSQTVWSSLICKKMSFARSKEI